MRIHLKPKGIINSAYIPYLQSNHSRQIFFGGSASGKSVFLSQRDILDVLQGRNFLVVRKVARTIAKSVFNECLKAIHALGLTQCFTVNKSEFTLTALNNGHQILFAGLDDPEKVKSITPKAGVLTDIRIEEATEITEDDYRQLERRVRGKTDGLSKRITLSFNPINKHHWIFKRFFATRFGDNDRKFDGEMISEVNIDGVVLRLSTMLLIVKTTHLDNKFLEEDDRRLLLGEQDPYWHSVYTLGNWGIAVGGRVYPMFNRQRHSDNIYRLIHGRDHITEIIIGVDTAAAVNSTCAVPIAILASGQSCVLGMLEISPGRDGQAAPTQQSRQLWQFLQRLFVKFSNLHLKGIPRSWIFDCDTSGQLVRGQFMGDFGEECYLVSDKQQIADYMRMRSVLQEGILRFHVDSMVDDIGTGQLMEDIEVYVLDENTQKPKKGQRNDGIKALEYALKGYYNVPHIMAQ